MQMTSAQVRARSFVYPVMAFFLVCCMLVWFAASAHAAPTGKPAACAGVIKVSYGTFSKVVVTGVTCPAAKTLLVKDGGLPHGWKCSADKTSATTTTDECATGAKSISYHFKNS